MRGKITTYVVWALIALAVLWAFDTGMKKQHEIDCSHGRYCNEG